MAYGALTQYGGQAVSNVKLPDKYANLAQYNFASLILL